LLAWIIDHVGQPFAIQVQVSNWMNVANVTYISIWHIRAQLYSYKDPHCVISIRLVFE
jgi:hypothetical protein